MKPAGGARGERGAAGDRVRVAVDGVEGAAGSGEDRGGIAAAAEGAVAVDRAVARREPAIVAGAALGGNAPV